MNCGEESAEFRAWSLRWWRSARRTGLSLPIEPFTWFWSCHYRRKDIKLTECISPKYTTALCLQFAICYKFLDRHFCHAYTEITCWNVYLGIEEDEIHLNESEHHSWSRSHRKEDVVTLASGIYLEILGEFQRGVNHRSYAESCDDISKELRHHLGHFLTIGKRLPTAPMRR